MKDFYNVPLIELTAGHIKRHYADFDTTSFINIASDDIENRELKDRSNQIFLALQATLPTDFVQAISILENTLLPVADNVDLTAINADKNSQNEGLAGWIIMPFTQYVGELGAKDENKPHLDKSMHVLKAMSKRFTSEFGIRFLLLAHPQECLVIMNTWLDDSCHHVRRLISEGTRPLLPWAMQLPEFKNDPHMVMPLLEQLRDDDSEYVRRSVANHLNDVAKHHPEFVADVAERWLKEKLEDKTAGVNRTRMVKHACRTLLKQGHAKTLSVFGYLPPQDIKVDLKLANTHIKLGEQLEIQLEIENVGKSDANSEKNKNEHHLMLDYVIYHQKANGKLTPKVFKWKTLTLNAGQKVNLKKTHAIKPITTRKYYAGLHKVAVQVNGKELDMVEFELEVN